MFNPLSALKTGVRGSRWRIERRTDPSSSPSANAEFDVYPSTGGFPTGWAYVRIRLSGVRQDEPCLVKLHIRTDPANPPRETSFMQEVSGNFEFAAMTKLYSHSDQALGIEILSRNPAVTLEDASVRAISRFEAGARIMVPKLAPLFRDASSLRAATSRIHGAWKRGGVSELKNLLRKKVDLQRTSNEYSRWAHFYDTLTEDDRAAIRAQTEALEYRPLISVVMPVYNAPEAFLRSAIDSVRRQLYPHWELCIADDCSTAPHVRKVLEEQLAQDSRIKVVFRSENGHISAATNSALEIATGEFVALLDHDDELAEHALFMVAEELDRHRDADLVYSDEDKIDERGRRHSPHFKPAEWNPDLFLSYNLINHLGVYRTSVLRKIGGFRVGFEGSQDYDVALRFIEQIPESRIRHIPHILYHWRVIEGSVAMSPDAKPYATEAARKALQEHLDRKQVNAEVVAGLHSYHRVKYALPEKLPLVSLIICTRDRVQLLRGAVGGMLYRTDYPDLEVIVVDNESKEPETLAYFEKIQADPRVRILRYEAPFNFSALNNFAARQAKGEILGLINNDIEVIHPDWLKEMVSHSLRPEVGGVGAKLYYPDDTIQHAGVVLGIGEVRGYPHGVAGHSHKGYPRSAPGYVGRLIATQDFSAVTAACMILRRSVYEEVGGLDEKNLSVAFNDVDFCLRIREKGYRIVFTPFAELYHLESASRGSDVTDANLPRFEREVDYMMNRWGSILTKDPCYSPNLTLLHENFDIAFPPRASKSWQTRA